MGVTLTKARTRWPGGWDKPSVVDPPGTVLFAGKVLGRGIEHSVRIMSDVWADIGFAEYWDDADGAIRRYDVSNSEFGADADTVTIDADAATYAKATEWLITKEYDKLVADFNDRAERAVDEANRVAKGKRVEVVRGRKVPKGTVGDVIWVGAGNFGTRVGVKDDAGTVHWTAATNVEVIDGWDWFDATDWVLTDARKDTFKKMAFKAALEHAGRNRWIPKEVAAAGIAAAA